MSRDCYLCDEARGADSEIITIEGVNVFVHAACAIERNRERKRWRVYRRARAWRRMIRILRFLWQL